MKNITFKDYHYERPNFDHFIEEANKLILLIGEDESFPVEYEAYQKFQKMNDEIDSLVTIASIRNSLDTNDKFYEGEKDFFDENLPIIQQYGHLLLQKLLKSKHIKKFEQKLGNLLFDQTKLYLKTFSTEIIEDLQTENKLNSDYSKIISNAKISFNDEIYNLSQMSPFVQDINRDVRKKAQLAVSNFFKENLEQLDEIYDNLVKVRNNMAIKLGYDNYVQMGYDRFGRTDYDYRDVKKYRDQIYEEVVPLVNELTKRKAKRLKIENPKSYDLALSFLSGNPTPKGDKEFQVNVARQMYKEMSSETHEFFEFMLNKELLELDSKPGKNQGGYCTYIPSYESPFIFANFNGTAHDVDVLTHEAGHAFQVYQSRNLIPEYRWPTMEAAEIHSMSMEFLAWPWVDKFFKEDTDKYKFNHLAGAVSFLPYGALVDEFQHYVYENPSVSPKERREEWRKLEKKYLPFKNYDEDDFLEEGGYWLRQGHIFNSPFYYIDYTLAQVVAFQYWSKSREDFDKALDSYLSLCKLGGSLSFTRLLKEMKLENPFKSGSIKEIIKPINEYLNSIDDLKL